MMFIVRTMGEIPVEVGFLIRQTRKTPALATGGTHDFFCDGEIGVARDQGLNVVPVHDGWYADDTGGGVAIWGQGRFWEIRDTPFTVRETSTEAPSPAAEGRAGEIVNVRNAIFGV
ncbi:MAG: hypothetical protein EXR07_05560 [Acetobacteraceae bacterium]|nr:hypothetical protein [Acetobacteraceae bacterium]